MLFSMRYVRMVVVLALALGGIRQAGAQPAPGWQVEDPEAFGFDRDDLARVYTRAEELAPLNSLLIARRGTLVAADYFRGMTARRTVNIKSASKSILSALVGIALEEGYLESLDQKVVDFFPAYVQDDFDPRKHDITLRHLLTMTSGLETTSFYNYGKWVASADWVRFALDQPMVGRPGGEMIYSTGSSHLVSAILTRATGMSTLAFAQRTLFEPLGIARPAWDRDPKGIYFGGNNMALRPTDLLKLGQLYLDQGRYEGRQILPAEWVSASTERYVDRTHRGFNYGYFWFIHDFHGYETHFAWGYGGQFIFVVPELDLVVVCTSWLSGRPRGVDHNDRIWNLLEDYILPSVH